MPLSQEGGSKLPQITIQSLPLVSTHTAWILYHFGPYYMATGEFFQLASCGAKPGELRGLCWTFVSHLIVKVAYFLVFADITKPGPLGEVSSRFT